MTNEGLSQQKNDVRKARNVVLWPHRVGVGGVKRLGSWVGSRGWRDSIVQPRGADLTFGPAQARWCTQCLPFTFLLCLPVFERLSSMKPRVTHRKSTQARPLVLGWVQMM